MKIVITGPKSSGKTTIGKALAKRLNIPFVDLDDLVLRKAAEEGIREDSCAGLFHILGEEQFRMLERLTIATFDRFKYFVLSTGGSTLLDHESRHMLRPASIWVYLKSSPDCLWNRLNQKSLPAYLRDTNDPRGEFFRRVERIDEVLSPRCDIHIESETDNIEAILDEIVESLNWELTVQANTPNTLGTVIRLTTFGESHGPYVGAVLDGIQPNIPLSADDIQRDLDLRRPGQSAISTARKELDKVEIVSGVFEGKTTGSPICLLIQNKDHRSSHYDAIKDIFRPGHADYTFWQKYGFRDYRGGGRSSGRETASRVAGGAVARNILANRGIKIRAYTVQIGKISAERIDLTEINRNPVRCPDSDAAKKMEALILEAKEQGDSVGGVIQLEVTGVPAGLGDPVFSKLDARLASGLFSLGAVKGIEFGSGFACARLRGSENNDQLENGEFLSNHAGGILGGISSGQPIMARVAVKPTPSIAIGQKTMDVHGGNKTLHIEGRHDPCIVPRIIPVIEAMAALTLLDAWEVQNRISPNWLEEITSG